MLHSAKGTSAHHLHLSVLLLAPSHESGRMFTSLQANEQLLCHSQRLHSETIAAQRGGRSHTAARRVANDVSMTHGSPSLAM